MARVMSVDLVRCGEVDIDSSDGIWWVLQLFQFLRKFLLVNTDREGAIPTKV